MINKRRGTYSACTSHSRSNGIGLDWNGSFYPKWRNNKILLGLLLALAFFYTSLSLAGSNESFYLVVTDLSKRVLETSSFAVRDIPRISLQDPKKVTGWGSQEPVLLENWTVPIGDWTKENLLQRVGNFAQYLKDSTVQPVKNSKTRQRCILPGRIVAELLPTQDILFFTNNQENELFMKQLNLASPPIPLQHINGFELFSAMSYHKSHSFHRHGESWLGQVQGRRQWWFLPPDTYPTPRRVNACGYLTGESAVPPGTTTITQEPGQIIWFPKDWYHATCALDDWTVGVGAQLGRTIRQNFPKLDKWVKKPITMEQIRKTTHECLGNSALATISTQDTAKGLARPINMTIKNKEQGDEKWKWFNGDLNAYYNSLEKDHKRDPTKLADYAVHRWLGPNRSTEEQYQLLDRAVTSFLDPASVAGNLQVLDGGCGLGSALMWMEQTHPTWNLTGYTVSEEQYRFIQQKLPKHSFHVHLKSYNDLEQDSKYDFIYSIEALIHSPNVTHTMQVWASHLQPNGIMAILDDFVVGDPQEKTTGGMQEFAKSWMANSLFSTQELGEIGKQNGLEVVEDRDLVKEYDIIGLNYRNQIPNIQPYGGRVHQGWMGSKWRQRLTVERKLTYNLLVMKKKGPNDDDAKIDSTA